MKHLPTLILPALLITLTVAHAEILPDFNFDWRFANGDQSTATNPAFDDSGWQRVDLPHDWAISGPFGPANEPGNTGKLPWQGEGWYRKSFELPAKAAGQRLQLIFDGVMSSPTVFLNGTKVGSWIYGYNSFTIDATDAARFGGRNVLAVHADTRDHGSRWYPGAGIYRKVTARLVAPVHIPVWGVFVTTPEVTAASARVEVAVEVTNNSGRTHQAGVETTLLDPAGNPVAKERASVSVAAGATSTAKLPATISNPQLWDLDDPRLYSAVTRLVVGGKQVGQTSTTFGLRSFKWTADDGFHLNGRRVQLKGVNLHHDQGPLGAAFFPRAMERQLEIMREMGVNSLRTSHNAPAPEVLDLCDRMGFIVFNELFDKYGPTAGINCGIDEFVEKHAAAEVRNFVFRDRNHPSVFLWSIGNEIGNLQAKHVEAMVGYYKQHDSTRPTTLGSHIPAQAGKRIIEALDTSGWNYASKYKQARETYPDKPLIYSESASAFGTRGAYKLDLPKSKTDYGDDGILSAYVLTAAPWSDIPEHEFERMRRDDYVAGEFVWTGFDYLGEPTPFNGKQAKERSGRQARSSYFGIVDLAGLPKDSYYLYRSHWNTGSDTVHLSPHWNWQGHEGKPVPVIVYTNGDEAELFLNGRSLGRKRKADPDALGSDNLAFNKTARASSEEHKQDKRGNVIAENLAGKAVDGNANTRWCAASEKMPQHWQVDLGSPTRAGFIRIHWEKAATNYGFKVLVSRNNRDWTKLQAQPTSNANFSEISFDPTDICGLRIEIDELRDKNIWASIREVEIMEEASTTVSPYFQVVDAYRLRWLNVPYAPGELRTVAYKNGKAIGEAIVRTAGKPAHLRLTAARAELRGDGMDLAYVTIEMLDADGNLCPLAMDELTFEVTGAAKLMGVANGDPMGFDVFTDHTHPLFYGKAVAVLRSIPGQSGPAKLQVSTKEGITTRQQLRVSN